MVRLNPTTPGLGRKQANRITRDLETKRRRHINQASNHRRTHREHQYDHTIKTTKHHLNCPALYSKPCTCK